MRRSLYLICYDITHNRVRSQVAALLQPWRVGGQRSVAECWLSQTEFARLWPQLQARINPRTDSLLALRHDLRSHDQALGQGTIYTGQPFIVG